ncbi:MAG: sigma-54 dependent transcriptional regulator, partial [Gammaproteobacteria bacterium]|nr:sigma-54 dependent transcriptional regulator [Gammaproteobacteria bacterium]
STVLIADDQSDVRESLGLLLSGEGYAIETAASPAEVSAALVRRRFDAVFLDLNYQTDTTSGREGLALLAETRERDPDLPVIVLTGWASTDVVVTAMQAGASDFLEKPWDNARVLTVLKNQIALAAARADNRRLMAEAEPVEEGGMVFRSKSMREVMATVDKVAEADVAVLLTGASGTGKGVVAREIHDRSRRAAGPFVHVNLGALPETLAESELFGHVKGAFTDARADKPGRFELADGGTLFLDEISNASAAMQARLLTVLESGMVERLGATRPRPVNVRLVAASNADLPALIEAGEFRHDLYFRLNTVEIPLPLLRERPEDIPALATHFLARFAQRHGKKIKGFGRPAESALLAYDWPGNVRELAHVIERAVLLAADKSIVAGDLRLPGAAKEATSLEAMSLEQAERYLMQKALDRNRGDAAAAARQLGVSRSAFYRRLAKLKQ